MDDEDDKVRRNIVAFSAIVLLVAWLEVPVALVVDRLSGLQGFRVEQGRAWSAAAVVMLYLAARYHYTGGGRLAWSALAYSIRAERSGKIEKLLEVETQRKCHHTWFHPALDEVIAVADAEFPSRGYNGPSVKDVYITGGQDEAGQPRLRDFGDEVTINVRWRNTAFHPSSHIWTRQQQATFRPPPAWRWFISCAATMRALFLSEAAVGGLVPVWFAAAASGVIGFRLGSAFVT